MVNNPKRPGAGGSTSFKYEEVDAMVQLLTVLVRGGDARDLSHKDPIRSVYGKFVRMKTRLDEERLDPP